MGGSPARACTPKCRFPGGDPQPGKLSRFQVISPDNGHPEVWGRLLADTGGDFSRAGPRLPCGAPLCSAWASGPCWGHRAGAAGRGAPAKFRPQPRGAAVSRRACRQRAGPGGSSSRPASAAQCAGAAGRFPRATAGAAAGLVRLPAPWQAARRGPGPGPRRASASPLSCWAPRCSAAAATRAGLQGRTGLALYGGRARTRPAAQRPPPPPPRRAG